MADETSDSSKEERREGVKKAFESPGPSAEPSPDVFEPAAGTEHVGESVTGRGEDVAKTEQEPGRYSTGTDDSPAERPTGESTPRDVSGLNPDKKE